MSRRCSGLVSMATGAGVRAVGCSLWRPAGARGAPPPHSSGARVLTLAKRSTAPALSSEYKMAGGLFIFALLRARLIMSFARDSHAKPANFAIILAYFDNPNMRNDLHRVQKGRMAWVFFNFHVIRIIL